jgi:hypothetical protein
MDLSFSLFQEPWWLAAATGGQYEEVTVERADRLVGRFPFVAARRGPFRISIMPAFTHLLGPVIEPSVGKYQSRLVRRLSIARELIDSLPSFAFFKQVFDPSVADGLGLVDGLAFQHCGFQVAPQYTFEIDCRVNIEALWGNMHTTVRQHIRRAEEKYVVTTIDDPICFQQFYVANIDKSGKRNRTNFATFPKLLAECKARSSGEILCAATADGQPGSMVFIVWGHGVMYYLLSTRAGDINDNGAVSLLIWSAIKRCHEMNLKLDLDGVYSSGSTRFLSGFGGQTKIRMIVMRANPVYRSIQLVKRMALSEGNEYFA